MAKLGSYSYPDIRFGDAVEIAGRVLAKFKGTVTVKGLAWELGMAENSGTLFAKIAALRDFGLVEGRGELRVSDLLRKIYRPVDDQERLEASVQSFQKIELLRNLWEKFQDEEKGPEDSVLLLVLEEITKATREEVVRRFVLIQKHLRDMHQKMRQHQQVARAATASLVLPTQEDTVFGKIVITVQSGSRKVSFEASWDDEGIDALVDSLNGLRPDKGQPRKRKVASVAGFLSAPAGVR